MDPVTQDQILLHQIIRPHILISDNPRRLWRFFSAWVRQCFCGACSAISHHCLALCLLSSCFLIAGQARRRAEFASVVFGHAFSHTAFQTDLLTCTHFVVSLSFSLPLVPPSLSPRAADHKIPGCHKVTCFPNCIRKILL